ncbi:MAG: metalloprotease [Myxococcales bacterium]
MERRGFDIQFRLGPVAIAIEPSFWLAALLLGLMATPGNKEIDAGPGLAVMMGVVLVSILVHELGHALMSHWLGTRASIRLYAFGGYTLPERQLARSADILFSLAGPFAGFVLGAAVLALQLISRPQAPLLAFGLQRLVWINFGWGAINLVPVLPLDGGRALLGILGPGRLPLALLVGAIVAFAAGFIAGALGLFFVAALFVLLAMRNLQARSSAREAAESEAEIAATLHRGWRALAAGNEQEAERVGSLVLEQAAAPEHRNRARDLLAWSALAASNPREALRHIERSEPPEAGRALTWALVLEAHQDSAAALPYALEAVEREPSETSARTALRLLLAEKRFADARQLAGEFAWPRPEGRDLAVAEVDYAEGRFAEAAAGFEGAFSASGDAEHAYRAAQAHARAGSAERALGWLERALEAGLDDASRLRSDPELTLVRSDPRLLALLERRPKASG